MVNNKQKNFQFKTISKNHLHYWTSAIEDNMNPFTVAELAPVNFWKLNRISMEEFLKIAETGDIVLF